jgi:hypothetical protein
MGTKHVLITGSPDRVASLAAVFTGAGIEPVALAEPGAEAPVIDYYVQLGVSVPARGDTVVRRVHSFLNDGLLDRFAVVERVLPMLADDAIVVLVAGNLPAEVAVPDDQTARLSLLRVLAHAMRADLAPKHARIRVVTSERTDEEIAHYALTGATDPDHPSHDDNADRNYEDWRIQLLGLVHIEL